MSGRLLEADPIQKRRVDWHHTADGGAVIENRFDVEDVVEHNKAQAAVHDGNLKADMHLLGRIPADIWADLERRGIAQDSKRLLRWIHDSDNKAWKIHPGRFI